MVRKSKKRSRKDSKALTSKNADRLVLYESSVQAVDAEIDFVDETFRQIRGRRGRLLREDFCGTGNTSCEWVRRRPDNYATGVDLDGAVMAWGRDRHIAKLKRTQKARVQLLQADVAKVDTPPQDIVLLGVRGPGEHGRLLRKCLRLAR